MHWFSGLGPTTVNSVFKNQKKKTEQQNEQYRSYSDLSTPPSNSESIGFSQMAQPPPVIDPMSVQAKGLQSILYFQENWIKTK